jgi:hypothetical protein
VDGSEFWATIEFLEKILPWTRLGDIVFPSHPPLSRKDALIVWIVVPLELSPIFPAINWVRTAQSKSKPSYEWHY